MYRSWAYIVMAVATLTGVVALLWPSPTVRTIEEIAMPVRPPRAEAPAKQPKAAAKAAASAKAAKPAPPAVLNRVAPRNTATKRAAPVLQNGLQPNMFGKPAGQGVGSGGPPTSPPPAKGAVTARPLVPGRSGANGAPASSGAP